MPSRLSETQRSVLRAMVKLGAHGDWVASAREVAGVSGQAPDGAAYTLRSLVRRELAVTGWHDGDKYGYRLTAAGMEEAGS